MVTEIKLGLCNPHEPIYLYVNQGEVDGESYVWYKFNISQDKKIPVSQRALTGYVSELRLTTKEFKGKDNLKLDIVVSADELYIVRTGIETNFAKSLLLAASLIQDFSKPLIIVANAGDENTVFCNLYDAATKTKIYREWSRDLDWATIIRDIQILLAGNSSTTPSTPKLSVVPQPVHPQDLRIKNIRTLLDYPLDLVREWLEFQNASNPSQLDISKIDSLVKTMCLAWAADKCEYPNHAESLYQKLVVDAVASGCGKASIRATARLANIDATGLVRSLKTAVDNSRSKLVEKLICKGFEAVEILGWSQSGIPDIAVAAILHYYGYEAGKRCTTQASLACEAFESIGVRAWIQDLLGWTKPANPSETAMTQIQLLAAIAQQMAEQEQYLLEQQQQQTQILARLKAVEVEQDRVNTPYGHKYSVVGFANLQGLEISVKEAGAKGRKASALCRKQGIEIERIHDPRFGKVGLYPESVLIEVFSTGQN